MYVKASVIKGVVCFGKRRKLSPQYVGPYEIMEKIGLMAYHLDLPSEMQGIHNVFHIYSLKRVLESVDW